MATPATTPISLVPSLPDVVNRRRKHIITDLHPGDQLHLTAAILGFPKGIARPVFGYCVHLDEYGQAYCVKAYVQPLALGNNTVAYAERDALRYPTANQKEQWFGSVLLYLTEIDLTDYADCLRLERLPESLAQLVAPELPAQQLAIAA